jgi:hypothetical protein
MTARKISGFLHEPASGLSRLAVEAKRLQKLAQDWEAIAPPGLARSSRVGPIRDRIVTLYADNGAIAARLKQQLPRLLLNFRQRGHDLTAIKVEVQVKTASWEMPKKAPHAPISPAGIASLLTLEADLEPSPLKQALTHLLQHQTRLQQDEAADGDQGQEDQ